MSRFMMTLAAAAAAAVAAIAAVALPAIGDSGSGPRAGTDADFAKFVACLRANGLPGAPAAPEDLKPWLGAKQASDPQATEAAERACNAQVAKHVPGNGPRVEDFVACLRDHGVDAPTAPGAFKRWMARQPPSDVMRQCKLELDPGPKPGDPGEHRACGEVKPAAGKAEPPAAKPEQPADESALRGT